MLIGIIKEIKNQEFRVSLTPASVKELISFQHQVLIESNAGLGVGFTDEDYRQVGAKVVETAQEVFDASELIVKVKEPQANEREMLNKKHTLFTYLHLAPDVPQTEDLMKSGATCIAYETVTDHLGRLPLLMPMSQVAGRMSIQAGASCLEKSMQGRGLLLGGVPGVKAAKVVIIGAGVVGQNAVAVAVGMGADVFVMDRSSQALNDIDTRYGNRVKTIFSNTHAIEKYVTQADLVVGSVLLPGAEAPKLITKELTKKMKKGSVLVDVAIDQGGCSENSRATTHEKPTFVVDDVVHYCVANMPGAVPRTSTLALNNATLPFILELANKGIKTALKENKHLRNGLNIMQGKVTCPSVAEVQNLHCVEPNKLLDMS